MENESGSRTIDRKALVRRHNPVIRSFNRYSSLSVGNGEFAFTVDPTGLQTFGELYADGGVPLSTMSNWAWHTSPNPNKYSVEKYPLTYYKTYNGRGTGYRYSPLGCADEDYLWLRANPHRFHLGQIEFRLLGENGNCVLQNELEDIHQTLDMWTGLITSSYTVQGVKVQVETCCHPELDMVAVKVQTPLIAKGRLQVLFHFPYGSPGFTGADWTGGEAHQTQLHPVDENNFIFERQMDDTRYRAEVFHSWGRIEKGGEDTHSFELIPDPGSDCFEFCCLFSPEYGSRDIPSYSDTRDRCEKHWEAFWMSGGAIELGDSKDPRGLELERRIVLSQYQTAIQSSGSLPPQESGLLHNSWAGKFHLEMHWWHSAHFAFWGREQYLEKSFLWYQSILEKARETARFQGYEGARWPKCVAPDGTNAPCFIEGFLIWQQPHPIYFAEQLYRIRKDEGTLNKYKEIVFETAGFMASFVEWDDRNQRYVLGPPVAPSQEIYDHATTFNPAYELSYWAWGLGTAQEWRKRLGLPREEKWDHILENLSILPVHDGSYGGAESSPDMLALKRGIEDHPSFLAPLGVLPGLMTDETIMRRTLDKVLQVWKWDTAWGWDFPMAAMTAARLGDGKLAVDMLLKDEIKNTYLPNGCNYQLDILPVYLPGNGGLLTATAMMAAGWDGCPDTHAPGFPQDGTWKVVYESLNRMI